MSEATAQENQEEEEDKKQDEEEEEEEMEETEEEEEATKNGHLLELFVQMRMSIYDTLSAQIHIFSKLILEMLTQSVCFILEAAITWEPNENITAL